MKQHQQGATLIVVLFVLLILTIIGTVSIRQSSMVLKVATSSQAQQLLTQNTDATFFNVEDLDNFNQSLSTSGMFGHINNDKDITKELVFCFRGDQKQFFNIGRASIIAWEEGKSEPTNSFIGKDGFCDAKNATKNFFTSTRRVVMTQVAVKFSTVNSSVPFSDRQRGTDAKQSLAEEAKRVKIFSVSVMPTLSSASRDDINLCLQNRMSEVTIPQGTTVAANSAVRQSITTCLTALNVPFTTHVTEYAITPEYS
ncbi:pilus assembly protein PilX [Acinetobacter sp. TGL-Y2]|uniref:pilus assembly PilX family protein n=1 Tax=Acinetobacter sp. TGL-Y2 TaxID=1407071 RepID=UPI0007A64B43|nr:pilus assembly PilX N-terminal domain-containing protein [Acinetobacter sp. TGL-Y2]AMW77719.1 pilus assembly protein PilX [Acinetobacter sp. TGL-Y2]